MQIQDQLNGWVLLQIALYTFAAIGIRGVIGGVVVQGSVVEHSDAACFQNLRYVGTDGDHIMVIVQGVIRGNFGVFLSGRKTFRAVGMDDQYGGYIAGQFPLEWGR